MKYGYLIYLFICFSLFAGCDIINPEEQEAAYISIQQVNLSTDLDIQGSNSSNIKDAWIYIDDNLIGAFPLPCKIPSLKTGNHKISIGAGIQVNGSSMLRTPYIFYRFYQQENVNLEAGYVTELNPVVTYFDSITFGFKANFDDLSGNKLTSTAVSDTTVELTTDASKVFEGTGSCLTRLLRDSGLVEFQMIDPVTLPKGGRNIFLELDYKTTHDLVIGLRSYYTGASTKEEILLSLRANSNWNKVYINLTKAVSTQVNAANYRIYFSAYKQAGSVPLEILLDNLKIVY